MSPPLSQIFSAEKGAPAATLSISPPAGEVSGRTEGGVKELNLSILATIHPQPIICGN